MRLADILFSANDSSIEQACAPLTYRQIRWQQTSAHTRERAVANKTRLWPNGFFHRILPVHCTESRTTEHHANLANLPARNFSEGQSTDQWAEQNSRQKVFARGAWDIKFTENSTYLMCFTFQFGGLSPPKLPRGDGTGAEVDQATVS